VRYDNLVLLVAYPTFFFILREFAQFVPFQFTEETKNFLYKFHLEALQFCLNQAGAVLITFKILLGLFFILFYEIQNVTENCSD
jgi:hypothetical protein